MIFFYPGSLMQEHLADRAKVEERLIWFLKRIEGINTLDEQYTCFFFLILFFFH